MNNEQFLLNLNEYLTSKVSSEITIKSYMAESKMFEKWINKDLLETTEEDVQQYKTYLTDEKKFTYGTTRRKIAGVNAILDYIDFVNGTDRKEDKKPKFTPETEEILEGFVRRNKSNKNSTNTINSYMTDIEQFILWADKDIKTVTSRDVNRYRDYLTLDLELADTSIRRKFNAMSSLFKYMVSDDYITKNPMDNFESIKIEDKETDALTETEAKQLLKAITQLKRKGAVEFAEARDLFLFEMLICTGLRIEEALSMKLKQFNTRTMEIYIPREKGKTRERYVPFPESLLKAYKSYMVERKHFDKQDKIKPGCEDLLILSARGGKMHAENTNETLAKVCEVAGLRRITNHTLRHTFCSVAIAKGQPIEKVTMIVGHANTVFTFKHYVHTDRESLKTVSECFDLE